MKEIGKRDVLLNLNTKIYFGIIYKSKMHCFHNICSVNVSQDMKTSRTV